MWRQIGEWVVGGYIGCVDTLCVGGGLSRHSEESTVV